MKRNVLLISYSSLSADIAALLGHDGAPCCVLRDIEDVSDFNLSEYVVVLESPSLKDFAETVKNIARSAPTVFINTDINGKFCPQDALTLGIHEVIQHSLLSERALEVAMQYASVRFESMRRTYERENMFLTLCRVLPHQMAYRMICRPDHQVYFVFVSEGVQSISGLSREQVLQDANLIFDQLLPEDRSKFDVAMKNAQEHLQSLDVEVRRRCADGVIRWINIRALPSKLADGTIIWDGIESDITPSVESREKIQKLLFEKNKLLLKQEKTLEALKETSRLKDEFLANLSHELRTPISSVLGWVRLMKNGRLPDSEAHQAIEIVERNALAQEQLIKELLDMNKIVSGKIHLEFKEIDLRQILIEAIEHVSSAAERKNLSIHQHLNTLDEQIIRGDAVHLKQIFLNLLSNAVKFTSENGRVDVVLERRKNGFVDCIISDNGVGIDKKILPFIFDNFKQADSSMIKPNSGLGLGLSIARKFVELHSGSIDAQNVRKGTGAVFTVRFPLADQPLKNVPGSGADQRVTLSSNNDGVHDLRGVDVLVVDDEPDALELARFILASSGCKVSVSHSAYEAFEVIEQRDAPFDVVVSDIGMPGKSGLDFIKELREEHPEYEHVQFIALTAFVGPANKKQIFDAGFEMHMSKPYEPDELAKCVMVCASGGAETSGHI